MSENPIEVGVFTATRAEYGLLKPLLSALHKAPDFNLHLLVGGAHLLESQGLTIKEIIADQFPIEHQFPYLPEIVNRDSISKALGMLQTQMGTYLCSQKLDFLVLLGDRYELLPVALSALVLGVPLVHISGGDITEGVIDDQVRHAVSKMAHIHFPGTKESAERLLCLGEEPWRVCVTGELAIDNILRLKLRDKEELFKSLGLDPNISVICATFHPETIENTITSDFVEALLMEVLRNFSNQIVVTAANSDLGGHEINQTLRHLARQESRIIFIKSMGQLNYFSLLALSTLVLGNSSSGIVEAKSFNVPVVDVGKRQQGRLANKNVIHVEASIPEVVQAIKKSQSLNFREEISREKNIHGDGNAVERMMAYLRACDRSHLLAKKFFQVNVK